MSETLSTHRQGGISAFGTQVLGGEGWWQTEADRREAAWHAHHTELQRTGATCLQCGAAAWHCFCAVKP